MCFPSFLLISTQLAASAPRTMEELQALVISGVSEQMKRQYGEQVVRNLSRGLV